MEQLTTTTTTVIVARHGERLDYVTRDAGGNWVAAEIKMAAANNQKPLQEDGHNGRGRPFDSPLTQHGQEQAFKLGQQLARETQRLQIAPISYIYSSPFLRCLQTAVSIQGAAAATAAATEPPMNIPPVRVELGLAESINENWYRSWSLPGANGTWGYCPPDVPTKKQHVIDPETLHPAAKQPIQTLLDWKRALQDNNSTDNNSKIISTESLDMTYTSQTTIDTPYTFHPRRLESRRDQQQRMLQVVEIVSQEHPGQTVVLVSHGGPVTHLYEELTQNPWHVHGESTYCCYSIYQKKMLSTTMAMTTTATAQQQQQPLMQWEPVVVNESKFLHEKLVAERHVSDVKDN